MKYVVALLFAVSTCAIALGQEYEPGHYDKKKGKYIEGHFKKKADHTGMHREHRLYEGHFDKKGKWIKPHSAWVWVKD
jgi:hypothetical protein